MALLRVLLALAFVIAVRAAPNWRISQGVDRCLRDLPELTECVGRARLGTQVLAEMVQCLRASNSTLHQDDIAARELCLKAELADNSTPDAFPLQLQVMYESKCPDSIRFFKEQLTPAFKVLGPERLVVDLIPYGIATTSVSSGTISFTCQHGESECLGNKLQACALVRLDDNAKQVAFVDCVMSSEDPSKPDTKCITDAGLDPTVLNNCATGNEGNVLLAGMGFRTLRGIPLYVPRLTFDGVYSDEDQKAEKNLLAAVCEKLPSNDRPKECPAPSPSQKPSPARTPASIPTATTVVIQFMYETKCRDSKNFVTQQLVDTFAALGSERLQVDFIPYGKSMMSADSGSVSITCHHGPQECVGNKAHACALARLSDNAKQIALVNCAFSSSDPTVLDSKCITDAGLDAADLASCAAGNEGNVLLANMGFRTVPHLPYQPRIILNGEYSEEDLDNAQANLLALVCEKLSPNVRPAACQSSPFVQVQVMYESLCKDSKAFITKQLFPTFTALGPQLMKVDFIPYGKATTSATSWSVSFTCQHGARECMGNKLQACALARLGDNAKQVAFVNCVMSSTDPSKPDDKCITDAGLDISDVVTCAAGYQGHTLLAAMGHRTLPNIPYVPRVTFNGAYTEDDQKNAEANLLPTVCEKLPSAVRPAACPSSSSAAPPTSQPSLPTSSPPPTAKSVQVQIMYEALCPYSIQLIKEQVAPALKALGPELMVADLIPYGIAQTYPTAEGYRFTCQHGLNECKGNMLQACGLARIADNKKRIEFVYCVMSSKDPSNPDEECYTNAGLNLIDMDSCSTGTQGQILLADMGFKTLPHIPFVPRISFNGVFNMDDQDNGQSNLILAVCEKLEPSVRPAACKAAPPPPTSGPVPTVPPSGPSSTMTPKPSSSSTFKSSLSAVFLALLTALLGHKQLR